MHVHVHIDVYLKMNTLHNMCGNIHARIPLLSIVVFVFAQVELKEVELAHQEAVKALKLVRQFLFT